MNALGEKSSELEKKNQELNEKAEEYQIKIDGQ